VIYGSILNLIYSSPLGTSTFSTSSLYTTLSLNPYFLERTSSKIFIPFDASDNVLENPNSNVSFNFPLGISILFGSRSKHIFSYDLCSLVRKRLPLKAALILSALTFIVILLSIFIFHLVVSKRLFYIPF